MIKIKRNYYYYLEQSGCYILKRPDSSEIAFLQGNDARTFEATLESLYTKEFPCGIFETYEQLLSAIIDQYDLS